MLTFPLWQQLYAASESAVGAQMRINGEPHTIVGVLPQGFEFVDPDVRLWVPLAFTSEEKSDDSRHSNNWSMIGRLKPGASVSQAQQQIDALNARNMERFPHFKEILTNAGFRTIATPFQDDLVREVREHLAAALGRRAVRFADRRGEHHQPRARAIERADEGAGDAARARGGPLHPLPAGADGNDALTLLGGVSGVACSGTGACRC